MSLQQQAAQQKTALEQQAMQLTMEYQQKAAEEEMRRAQYEMQKQQYDMQMKMQSDMAKMAEQNAPKAPQVIEAGIPRMNSYTPVVAEQLGMPATYMATSSYLPAPGVATPAYGTTAYAVPG